MPPDPAGQPHLTSLVRSIVTETPDRSIRILSVVARGGDYQGGCGATEVTQPVLNYVFSSEDDPRAYVARGGHPVPILTLMASGPASLNTKRDPRGR